jgi:hypothetical protein
LVNSWVFLPNLSKMNTANCLFRCNLQSGSVNVTGRYTQRVVVVIIWYWGRGNVGFRHEAVSLIVFKTG